MILPLAGFFLGAAFGAWRAKARQGVRIDLLHWAIAHGLLGALLGLLLLVVLSRIMA